MPCFTVLPRSITSGTLTKTPSQQDVLLFSQHAMHSLLLFQHVMCSLLLSQHGMSSLLHMILAFSPSLLLRLPLPCPSATSSERLFLTTPSKRVATITLYNLNPVHYSSRHFTQPGIFIKHLDDFFLFLPCKLYHCKDFVYCDPCCIPNA